MKNINFTELKIMLENNLFSSSQIIKNEHYSIVFFTQDNTSYTLVKDKQRDKPRIYQSIDRLVWTMREMGYLGDFKVCFLKDND